MKQNLYGKRILLRCITALAVCFVVGFLVCTKLPTTTEDNTYSIQLALEDGVSIVANYSGAPIKCFITLSKDTTFDAIAWHLGSGYYSRNGILPSEKSKTFEVDLFWKSTPALRDTVRKLYYDSIYVSLAGELEKSNTVKVYVTNVPPQLDSVRIGATKYTVLDTIQYMLSVTDTQKQLIMKIGGHDVNRDTLRYEWFSVRSATTLGTSQSIIYQVPQAEFADTIFATMYDGKGGSARAIIDFTKLPPNTKPIIDSIRVGAMCFTKDSSTKLVSYSSLKLDSLPLHVYARDVDAGDVITYTWTHRNAKDSLLRNAAAGSAVVLHCDSMYNTAISRDSAKNVDTVTILVKDKRGDSTMLSVRVVYGHINTPIRLDSLCARLKGVVIASGASAVLRDSLDGKDTVFIKVFTTDPDTGDSVRLSGRAIKQTQISVMGDSVVKYACRDSLYKDSIVIVVKDLAGDSAKKAIVITVINRLPIIDSLSVGDTGFIGKATYKPSDSVCERKDTLYDRDSLTLQVFAHDPDLLDTATVRWTVASGITLRNKDAKGTSVLYKCADTGAYNDTVTVLATDKRLKTVSRTIVLHIKKGKRNIAPRFDSLKVNGITQCKGLTTVYRDSANAKDTIRLHFYTTDTDSGDSVKAFVAAKVQAAIIGATDTSAYFVCPDSLYKDSIVVTVKDIKGDSARKSVVISVVNRYPVIDSLQVTDTLLAGAKRDSVYKGTDSVFIRKDTVAAKDSIRIHLFGHDPDAALKDSLYSIVWTLSANRSMKLLDTRGQYVQYPCRDATYKDTINVRVTDRKAKTARKSLIINVKK